MSEIGSLVKDFLQLHTTEQKLRKQVTDSSKLTKESKTTLIDAMESSNLQKIRALSCNADIILIEKPKKATVSGKNIKVVLEEEGLSEEQINNIIDKLTIKTDKVNKILKFFEYNKRPNIFVGLKKILV